MPVKNGTTVAKAREIISGFLRETGCYDICARCPVYPGGEGCCHGCGKLARDEAGQVLGCSQPNLSCLTYTCAVLDRHLIEQDKFSEFNDLAYGLPREGYRGCQPIPGGHLLQVGDPLREVKASIELQKRILSASAEGEE